MGVIKTILGLAILAAILIGGFWLSPIYTGLVSPKDSKWVMLNEKLPAVARDWACTQLKNKNAAEVPDHCNAGTAVPPQ